MSELRKCKEKLCSTYSELYHELFSLKGISCVYLGHFLLD